jgi:hypothetical protein
MSTIDQKFEKLLEQHKDADEALQEDAATGVAAIKKGAVPAQKSDLKNDGTLVAQNSKEKPEGDENVGAKAAAPVGATKDSTIKTKPSGASSAMPGALSAKIFDSVEKEGEVVAEEESTIDMSEDVAALLNGEELSEEFQEKAKTIFESAVKAKLTEEVARLEEAYAQQLSEQVESIKEEFAGRMESFLAYACEEWMTENQLAIEHGLRLEIAEGFMEGLRNLFVEHNINVPEEQVDAVEEMTQTLDEMEARLNEQIEKNVELHERVNQFTKNEILNELSRGLAETQKDKFASLAEAVEFKTVEDYVTKLETIKESYFSAPKAAVKEEVEQPEIAPSFVSESMDMYVRALSRFTK